MENEKQGRRRPENQVLTNPAKFFIQWKSKDEAFIYYNKDKKEDVKMPKPFVFIPLSMAYTLKGYNQKKQKSYIANEVENIETDVFTIRSYDALKKVNVEWTGLYKDIKDIFDDNIKYTISLYAAIKNKKGEMALVNLQLNGAALFHWFEFAKKNDIWSNAIKVEKDTNEKNGAVSYKAPVYELVDLSKEDDIKAADLQDEINAYLKDYYAKNRASNPAPKVDQNQDNGLNKSSKKEEKVEDSNESLPPIFSNDDDDVPW